MTPNRQIRIPGEELLPPSTRPLPPSDIKPNEQVRVIPPCPPWQPQTKEDLVALSKDPHLPQLDRRYWRMADAFEIRPTGFVTAWKNEPQGPSRYGSGFGVEPLPEPCIFEVDPEKKGRGPSAFWEGNGLFGMSTQLLETLLEADPEAIVHRKLLYCDPQGNIFDEGHHYVDVIRNVEAIDYANSIVDYISWDQPKGEKTPWVTASHVSSRIIDNLDPSYRIFRQTNFRGGGSGCFISDDVKQKIESLSPPIRNIAFHPISYLF